MPWQPDKAPGSDVLGEVGPDVASRNEVAGSPNARMALVLEVVKEGETKRSRDKWVKNAREVVAVKKMTLNRVGS